MRPLIDMISAMPKCELHIHAEAVVSADTYFALNKKYKVFDGIDRPEDFAKFFKINSLKDMIKNFYLLQSLFRSLDDYLHFIKDVGDYCANNHIVHIELHFAPSMVKKNGYVPVQAVYETILDEFSRLKDSGGASVELIVDLSRSFGVENAEENLRSVLRHNAGHARKILGVGLGGQELGNPCLPYKRLFEEARAEGLRTVIHAGEEVGPESVWEALECGAQRIGHATSAYLDERLVDALRERQTPLEICPTSNIATGKIVSRYEDHPISRYYAKGLNLTLNTDDPVLFNTTLDEEYGLMGARCGFGAEDLARLCRNSFLCSFSAEKERLLAAFDAHIAGTASR